MATVATTPYSQPITSGPAKHAVAVTPDDSNDLTYRARGLYIGGAGNVKVDTAGGETVTFTGVAGGAILPVSVTRVYSTGTTATSIVSLY